MIVTLRPFNYLIDYIEASSIEFKHNIKLEIGFIK